MALSKEKKSVKAEIVKGGEIIQLPKEANMPDLKVVKAQLDWLKKFSALIFEYLTPKVDYGVIPGTKQRSLLKPGADKLNKILGLSVDFEISYREDAMRGEDFYIEFEIKTILHDKNGIIWGRGVGSKNSWEPNMGKTKLAPHGVKNNILKMAKKRSLIDATLSVAVIGEHFTQDLDEKEQRALILGNGIDGHTGKRLYGYIYSKLGVNIHNKNKKEVAKEKEWAQNLILYPALQTLNKRHSIALSSPMDPDINQDLFKELQKEVDLELEKNKGVKYVKNKKTSNKGKK